VEGGFFLGMSGSRGEEIAKRRVLDQQPDAGRPMELDAFAGRLKRFIAGPLVAFALAALAGALQVPRGAATRAKRAGLASDRQPQRDAAKPIFDRLQTFFSHGGALGLEAFDRLFGGLGAVCSMGGISPLASFSRLAKTLEQRKAFFDRKERAPHRIGRLDNHSRRIAYPRQHVQK
ncbi:unnamed protein product, partial [Prorocentrum cordatum]